MGLTGELRAVSALNQRLAEVRRLGFTKCLIPRRVQGKLAVPEGLELIRVSNIREPWPLCCDGLEASGTKLTQPPCPAWPGEAARDREHRPSF